MIRFPQSWHVVFLQVALAAIETAGGAEQPNLVIISPADYRVFQRETRAAGTIDITTRLSNEPNEVVVEARLTDSASNRNLKSDWISLAGKPDKTFSLALAAPVGGWYQLDVRARVGDQTVAALSVAHVGVGEVFVVGGQSNSTCYGEQRQNSLTGLVSNFDGKSWTLAADPLPGVDGKGGSIWPIFGDAMATRYKVPIGIVPVGAGSTSVRQWLPAGERVQIPASTTRALKQVGEHEWECDGVLFARMVSRMKALGPTGFRAMLWHQGESDANQADPTRTLPREKYQEYLKDIIAASRNEIGRQIPWFIAQATYHTPTDPGSPDIRAAQRAIWESHIALQGPDTDTLTGDNREHDGKGVHFSNKGLHAHADLWLSKISDYLDPLMNRR